MQQSFLFFWDCLNQLEMSLLHAVTIFLFPEIVWFVLPCWIFEPARGNRSTVAGLFGQLTKIHFIDRNQNFFEVNLQTTSLRKTGLYIHFREGVLIFFLVGQPSFTSRWLVTLKFFGLNVQINSCGQNFDGVNGSFGTRRVSGLWLLFFLYVHP